MNRKTLLKLIVCDAALALLVLGYSWFFPFGKQWIDLFDMSGLEMLLYQFLYGQMLSPAVLVLLVSAFTWATYRVASPCKRWQLAMALNAFVCMAAAPTVFMLMLACGENGIPNFSLTFSRMVFMTGLMTIVLSFPLKLLKRKGLVA